MTGDNMKIKMFVYIAFSIILGSLFGQMIFKQYNNNLVDVFKEATILYFLQQGVYSTVQSMEDNTKNLKDYVYIKDNNYYRVYAAITKDIENITKLKEYFNSKGNDIYVKEMAENNKTFLNILGQYDKLIKTANNDESMTNIIKEVLIKYKELVVNGEVVN